MKTGFTNNAGRCLVTSATRNEWQIVSVVLGADTKKIRTKDSINLIEFAFNNFEQVNIGEMLKSEYSKWKESNSIKVKKGKKEKVQTVLDEISYKLYPVKKDEVKDIKCNIYTEEIIEAPVNVGDIVGKIELKVGNKEICKVNIKCEQTVERNTVWDYFVLLLKQVNFIMA